MLGKESEAYKHSSYEWTVIMCGGASFIGTGGGPRSPILTTIYYRGGVLSSGTKAPQKMSNFTGVGYSWFIFPTAFSTREY